MIRLRVQKMNLNSLESFCLSNYNLTVNSHFTDWFPREEILTCRGSCAWQSQAGKQGTATRRLGPRRGRASDRTGGRLYYIHRTRSACRPHLQGEKPV